jgi:hypothetical protein
MSIPEDYQTYAQECLAWAREAKDDAERKAFLDMARAWTQAAAKVNSGVVPIDIEPLGDTNKWPPSH